MKNTSDTSEVRLAKVLSRLLLYGLTLAVVLLLAGVVLTVIRPDVVVARESSLLGLPSSLAALEPGGFFALGLLVLLATPVARVVALFFAFARRRVWLFAGIALLIIVVLSVSGYVGLRTG